MQLDSSIATVVTGAASGLGAATAQALYQAGAKVALLDRDFAKAESLARELGKRAIAVAIDVSNPASVVTAFAEARAKQGQERVLVNCAGIAIGAKTVSRGQAHDAAAFAKVININLIGTFLCTAEAAAGMVAAPELEGGDHERGVIISTASVAAFEGQVGQAAYAASKAGVAGMTLPIARDLADKGVRVMTIAPGIFHTPMMDGMPQEVQDSLGKQIPFPSRLGRPHEYANLALAIISNVMLNGEVIRLDGAIRMGPR